MDPIIDLLISALEQEHKILICGNGGSAAQASHFAAELVVRYREDRAALPCIALNDPAILTAAGNDLGYEQVFARQVMAYGAEGDVLIAISTSGKSENVLQAIYAAELMDMHTVVLTGAREPATHDGAIKHCHVLNHQAHITAEIQEMHMRTLHEWARQIEDYFVIEAAK